MSPEDTISQLQVSNELLRTSLVELLRHVHQSTCTHEETFRGGTIWEICSMCGAKWADDEGGKPEFVYPNCVLVAERLLDKEPVDAVATKVLQDGARYNWLRQHVKEVPLNPKGFASEYGDIRLRFDFPVLCSYTCVGTPVSLDEAIDEKMAPGGTEQEPQPVASTEQHIDSYWKSEAVNCSLNASYWQRRAMKLEHDFAEERPVGKTNP